MFNLIGTLFLFFIFLILLVAFGVINFFTRVLFGKRVQSPYHNPFGRQRNPQDSQSKTSANTGKKKIFDSTDGEYIDFEEVK